MKKNSLIVMGIMASILTTSSARAENALSVLRDYGIPCAVSMGLSAALIKEDGLKVGSALCAGLTASTLLNKKLADEHEIKMVVEKENKERDLKISQDLDSRFEEIRRILREILAERLIKMEEDVRSQLEKKMNAGDFLPSLEKRLSEKLKEEVILEGKARNREIINQVVDEALRQLTSKKYGIPESSDKE